MADRFLMMRVVDRVSDSSNQENRTGGYPTKPGDPDGCFTNTTLDLLPDKSRVVVLDEAGFRALLAGDERYELAIS